jgi:hypothetical protein
MNPVLEALGELLALQDAIVELRGLVLEQHLAAEDRAMLERRLAAGWRGLDRLQSAVRALDGDPERLEGRAVIHRARALVLVNLKVPDADREPTDIESLVMLEALRGGLGEFLRVLADTAPVERERALLHEVFGGLAEPGGAAFSAALLSRRLASRLLAPTDRAAA